MPQVETRKAPTFAGANLERATGDLIYFDGDVQSVPRGSIRTATAAPEDDQLAVRQIADVPVHAAGRDPQLPGGRKPRRSARRRRADRRDRDREADDRHHEQRPCADRAARACRLPWPPRCRGACLVPLATDREAGAGALPFGRRGRRWELRGRVADRSPGRDRAPDSAVRRDGATAGRGGGARAQLPDVRLARVAHAADGDPRPCRSARRGPRRGSRVASELARDRRSRGAAARAARRRHPRPRKARRSPLHGDAGGGRHGAACSTAPIRRSRRRRGDGRSTTASR